MAFKTDFSKATDFGGVKDGEYEVIVKSASEDATPGGAEFINIDFVIRNDIRQEFQNFHIFHRIWKKKADNKYPIGMVMALAKNLSMQDGKEYDSLQAFLDDFSGHVCKVRVANEKSTGNNGKEYENLNIKQFKETVFQNTQHKWKKNDQPDTTFTVEDDDLPF